jgi:serine/threonine-protein kinase RsbW
VPEKLRSENGTPRHPGLPLSREAVIPSDPAEARRVQEEIERALHAHHFEEREIFGVRLALEEALVNAIKHGNQLDHSRKVHIRYQVSHEVFQVHIRDEGTGFDPDDLPDPMAVENLERPCGRGLLLMRHYMNEVTFHPPGNVVSMVKHRANGHRNGHA